jgi:membrane protease YdiL (CAAX protease family)
MVVPGQESTTQWRIRDFAWAVAGGLIGAVVVLVPVVALGGNQEAALVIGSLGQYAGHFLAIGLLVRRRGGAAALGFAVEPIDGVFLFVGMFLQIALAFLLAPIAQLLGDGDSGQAIADQIRGLGGTGARVGMAGAIAVLAPITEELMFRGILLKTASRHSVGRGVFVSALIFALFHVYGLTGDFVRGLILTLPAFFLVGVVLARVTVWRKRLGPAIFIHAGFNLLAILVLFLPPELLEQAGG